MHGRLEVVGVEIEELTGLGHLASTLARWHHDEWGHLYDPAVWNHDVAVAEFEAMARPESTDRTWVAFDGPDRSGAGLLGSVSLLATDDLPGFDHLAPWLASLYVRPDARSRGVGGLLVDALLGAARAAGHEYVHLFTSGQEEYYAARGWIVVARVEAHGHPATVMARGTHPRSARRAVRSGWCSDPDTNGAYSYLRVGGTSEHRARLADEILPGLWFAGEATSVEHPATMHGAWFSGERAARQVLATGVHDVLVVGAGLAGLVTARVLAAAGVTVTVVESRDRPGGRIVVDTSLGTPLPLGGAWLHGEVGHPLAASVTWEEETWEEAAAAFVIGHGRLSAAESHAVALAVDAARDHYARCRPEVSVADALAEAFTVVPELAALGPAARAAAETVLLTECESLYAAPVDDIAANGGFEDYALPGDDRLITGGLDRVPAALADGLDVRYEHRISSLRRDDATGRWLTDTGLSATSVVVTVPIGAMRTGRISFEPPLPDDVAEAVSMIGAGPVVKVFAEFDERWWPQVRPIHLAGGTDVLLVTDMTPVVGRPVLCGFAVGDAARRIESMSEHDVCRLLDHDITATGLRDWDA